MRAVFKESFIIFFEMPSRARVLPVELECFLNASSKCRILADGCGGDQAAGRDSCWSTSLPDSPRQRTWAGKWFVKAPCSHLRSYQGERCRKSSQRRHTLAYSVTRSSRPQFGKTHLSIGTGQYLISSHNYNNNRKIHRKKINTFYLSGRLSTHTEDGLTEKD